MKAAIHTRYGPPEVLQVKKIDTPAPGLGEILIKVYATTVNRSDCAILQAKPFIMRFTSGLFQPKKIATGTDFAGVVVNVGDKVENFRIGDRVLGFDDGGVCSHAEYLTIPSTKAIEILPGNISFMEAAASLEGFHYAYNFINKINLQKGNSVLINGASGAIGSALLQLCVYYGANVTAVCPGKYLQLMKSLRAVKTINYESQDFTKDDKKYDFVFDAVGKSSFGRCRPLLKPKGVYISSELGKGSQNIFLALLTPLFQGKKVAFPIPFNIRRSIRLAIRLLQENAFTPVIDKTYPLEEISNAFRYVLTGQKKGNVVLLMEKT